MRFIARCYKRIGKYKEAQKWINLAIKEAPYLREPFVEGALIDYELKNWNNVIDKCFRALDIKRNNKTYINEVFCYDHTIYDLLSLAFYEKGLYQFSLISVNEAIKITPNEPRLLSNKKLIENKINENNSN